MKKNKIIGLVLLIVILVAIIGVLISLAITSVFYNKNAKNPIVTLDIDGYGEVQIELYPEYAPNTVSTIIKLIQNKYYDGKVFYGTDGSTIQVGMMKNEISEENNEETESTDNEDVVIKDEPTVSDLDTSVTSGSADDYEISILGEFVANGYEENTLRFEKGVVGLLRSTYTPYTTTSLTQQSYNSGNSLFFVCMEENSSINGLYAPFGKIVKGFDILEEIEKLNTIDDESAEEGQIQYFETLPVIKTATVDTFGIDYGMPNYMEAFDYEAYSTEALLQYYQNQ